MIPYFCISSYICRGYESGIFPGLVDNRLLKCTAVVVICGGKLGHCTPDFRGKNVWWRVTFVWLLLHDPGSVLYRALTIINAPGRIGKRSLKSVRRREVVQHVEVASWCQYTPACSAFRLSAVRLVHRKNIVRQEYQVRLEWLTPSSKLARLCRNLLHPRHTWLGNRPDGAIPRGHVWGCQLEVGL